MISFHLDMQTLVLLTGMEGAFFCLPLLYLSRTQKTYPGITTWAFASLSGFAGLVLLSLQGFVPDAIGVIVANVLSLGANLLIMRGLNSFTGRPQKNLADAGIVLLLGGALFIFLRFWPSLGWRIFVYSELTALVCIRSFFITLRHLPRLSTGNNYLLLGSFALVAAWFAARGVLTFAAHEQATTLLSSGIVQQLSIVVAFGLDIVIESGLILTISNRLRNELVATKLEVESSRALVALNQQLKQEVLERRLAESELSRSEERMRLAAEAAGFGIYSYSFETGSSYFSPEAIRLFGWSADAPMPKDKDLAAMAASPSEREALISRMREAADPRGTGVIDHELRVVCESGEVRWLRVRGKTTFRGNGRDASPIMGLGVILDNTARKEAAEKLRESEEMYRSVIENSLQGVGIFQDGRIVLCNDALCRLNGYTREEAYGMSQEEVLATVHPEDRQKVIQAIQALAENPHAQIASVLRLMGKSETTKWVEVLGAQTMYKGSPALQLSYIDITEKRRAEDAYHSLIDNSVLGMAILQNGRVTFVNNALVAMSGFTAAEMLQMEPERLDDSIHEEDRAKVLASRAALLAGRESSVAQKYRLCRCDGSLRWVETQSVKIVHEEGAAIQVTYKDVTAEMTTEAQLEKTHAKMRNLASHLLYAREEERRKVAQEIHDELGQTLTAVKMDLHWLRKHMGEDVALLREKVGETIQLGEQSLATVHRIASELRPKMLDDLGLEPALEWLCSTFAQRTRIACHVTSELPPGLVGGNAATALYRIIQEALENVGRHSHAEHAAVRLFVEEGELRINVDDDGTGITAARADAPDSFGLIGMRERVEALGGILSIKGISGFGTFLRVSIPLPENGGLA
jgi:two-component system, NarL family, sensor histidine kinase UhpB